VQKSSPGLAKITSVQISMELRLSFTQRLLPILKKSNMKDKLNNPLFSHADFTDFTDKKLY